MTLLPSCVGRSYVHRALLLIIIRHFLYIIHILEIVFSLSYQLRFECAEQLLFSSSGFGYGRTTVQCDN
jgi:hypothetical protein